MSDRDAFLTNASACRERAKTDAAHADYWIDQAIDWLQRAAQTSGEAVTYEVRDGRMIPNQESEAASVGTPIWKSPLGS